ncbi:hypothetical protein ACUNV4_00310 [Granulosicoccus sp. 3-233]|uniref:hypothetical protein n=1 Tax=Granulosicoccus sp. 3-233 TaxID=3417969 RepID=UPI003D3259AF
MKLAFSRRCLGAGLGLVMAASIAPAMVTAQSGPSDNEQQRPGRGGPPPQEAFDACASLTVDDSCSVQTPNGTLEGTCQQAPRNEQLLCVPAR